MSITIVFGSDGGTTRSTAKKIAARCNARVVSIRKAVASDFEQCSLLILACPTYGTGELQSDWADNLNKLEEANLSSKKVALLGLADQVSYPFSFADAIGILYDIVVEKGAEVVGFTSIEDYSYAESLAVRDGQFVGLVLDEDNQSQQSDKRIDAWLSAIK